MISDPTIREQGYNFFLAEAPELLEQIQQDLLTLPEDQSTAKVHNLMRAAHTLKGGAANVELQLIQEVAHSLEDIFKVLYQPDVVIDSELHTLLLEGYECLRTPISAEISGSSINESEIRDRTSSVFAKLKDKLADHITDEAYIPSSVELGFDIAESIFQMGVKDRLEAIESTLKSRDSAKIIESLQTQAEVFIGLAESLNLPGFGAIAQTILAALEHSPDQAETIAQIALEDLKKSREAVLGGDRTSGGEPSAALQQLAQTDNPLGDVTFPAFVQELKDIQAFLETQALPEGVASVYLKTIHCLLGWFHQYENIPQTQLSLSTLLPTLPDGKETLSYLQSWLKPFLKFAKTPEDSKSLIVYRQGAILASLLAVAKFQSNSPIVIQALNRHIQKIIKIAKQYPARKKAEKQWLETPKFQKLIIEPQPLPAPSPITNEDSLLEEIWGDATAEDEEIPVPSEESSSLSVSEASELTESSSPSSSEEVLETYPSPAKVQHRQYVRVELEGLERLNHFSGELLINHNRQLLQKAQLQQALYKLLSHLKRHSKTLGELREWTEAKSQPLGIPSVENRLPLTEFDSLEFDQYSDLHLQLHSALEDLFQLEEAAESIDLIVKQSNQTLDRQQRLLSHVRDDLLEARMLPLGTILNRFTQMIEKMALTYGKLVEFRVSGTEVLVDKAIAEKLYDPLLHLVRNAFDHGIETPEMRRQQGKAEKGLIEICAYYQGSQAIIEVRDDGKGLNMEKIVRRAGELQLLPNTAAISQMNSPNPDSSTILDVLFQPGFSTAAEVSEISGRGIGLDIVRSQLQSMNGSVTVQSSPKRGTTFVLQIPFSMTTAKLLLVQAGEAVYALLLDTIERVLLPNASQFKELEGKKVLHWNLGNEKAVISVRQLQDLVHYNSPLQENLKNSLNGLPIIAGQDSTSESLASNPVCLLKGSELAGLEVDQVLGDQEMVIRPLGQAIAPPKYVCGCSILGDGRLILVIDSAALFRSTDAQPKSELLLPSVTPKAIPAAPQGQLPPSRSSRKRVMVVDDAVSLRQTLSLTLQKAGYKVVQAQDGLEALKQLQQQGKVDVVLCDLEMPRMNGFEFLSQVSQDPNLAKVPVVMLTSRNGDKHRQLAKELGAQGYFTKPYLEQELLGAITQLIENPA